MEDEKKHIKDLTHAINRSYGSSWWAFWRGLVWGIGRTVGSLIIWGLALTILFQILQATGIWDNIANNIETLNEIRKAIGR